MRSLTAAACGAIILTAIALTGCASRAAAPDPDARTRYLTAMCPVARAFTIREHEVHQDPGWIVQDDTAARSALVSSLATLSRGSWPAPIADDVLHIQNAQLVQLHWFDVVVTSLWSPQMYDPPPHSAIDSQANVTDWLHIELDDDCAALPPDAVDAALRRDYLSASCRASLAFGQLLDDQIHGGAAMIRHDGSVSHAAFLAELETLDPRTWPSELATEVGELQQNELGWAAWTARVARDGAFPAYPPLDPDLGDASVRVDARLGVDPGLDCPTI